LSSRKSTFKTENEVVFLKMKSRKRFCDHRSNRFPRAINKRRTCFLQGTAARMYAMQTFLNQNDEKVLIFIRAS